MLVSFHDVINENLFIEEGILMRLNLFLSNSFRLPLRLSISCCQNRA